MGAYLSNPSFMENNDSICMLDGGKAMSDDDRCPPFEQLYQALLNQPFRFRIDMRSGLVENQDFWIDV